MDDLPIPSLSLMSKRAQRATSLVAAHNVVKGITYLGEWRDAFSAGTCEACGLEFSEGTRISRARFSDGTEHWVHYQYPGCPLSFLQIAWLTREDVDRGIIIGHNHEMRRGRCAFCHKRLDGQESYKALKDVTPLDEAVRDYSCHACMSKMKGY